MMRAASGTTQYLITGDYQIIVVYNTSIALMIVPEYPFGLSILLIPLVLGYVIIRRKHQSTLFA